MADPFLAEIRMFAGNFAPTGWAFCNGQLLTISQNTALFSLLGTSYGGNGRSTFGLPNMQGNVPLHRGQGPGLSDYALGDTGGSATVTLLTSQLPPHTHTAQTDTAGGGIDTPSTASSWGTAGRGKPAAYAAASALTAMSPSAIATTGSSQPHNNMSPYLAVNFIIALQGVFPPRS